MSRLRCACLALAQPGTDATVNTLGGVTITVVDTDADQLAFGIYNESTAAADTGVGDPSVEVSLGVNNTITVDADGLGGEVDGAMGIYAVNSNGGGTGSISVNVGDGADIRVYGDGSGAIIADASAGTGDVSITVGTGNYFSYAGDDTDSAGLLPANIGLGALSGGGDITITSGGNVQAGSAGLGAVSSAAIGARTLGAGTITVTTNLGSFTAGSDTGITTGAENGATIITTNSQTNGFSDTGIDATSTGGAITITNNFGVQGGLFGIFTETDSGAIIVNANEDVLASNGTAIHAFANLAGGTVDINGAAASTITGIGVGCCDLSNVVPSGSLPS